MDIAKLTVPLFIGTVLNWALLGALLVQVYIYFLAFPKDRKFSKLLVVFILVAEILQTATDTRNTIRTFGADWGNFQALDEVGWAWFSVPIIGSTIACVGQLFFGWRIYIISRKLYIPILIGIITMVQLAAGIWSGVQIGSAKKFSRLQFDNIKTTIVWLSATSFCDLVIVFSTMFYLIKSRKPGFGGTNAIISRIIKLTVETGVLCALFALTDLFLFVQYKGTNYHLAVCIQLSKIYSNSIILILNSRANIGHAAPETDVNMVSNLVFKSGTEHQARVGLAMSNGGTVSTGDSFPYTRREKYNEAVSV